MQRCRLRGYRPIPLRGFGNPSSKPLNCDDYDKVRTFFDDDDDDYYYGDDHDYYDHYHDYDYDLITHDDKVRKCLFSHFSPKSSGNQFSGRGRRRGGQGWRDVVTIDL